MFAVPPILVTMSFHPAFDKHDMGSLKLITGGAAPLGRGLVKKVLAKFAERGNSQLSICQAYVQYPSVWKSVRPTLWDALCVVTWAGMA